MSIVVAVKNNNRMVLVGSRSSNSIGFTTPIALYQRLVQGKP